MSDELNFLRVRVWVKYDACLKSTDAWQCHWGFWKTTIVVNLINPSHRSKYKVRSIYWYNGTCTYYVIQWCGNHLRLCFPHVKNLKNLKINCRCLRINGTKMFGVKLSTNGVGIVSETHRWFISVPLKSYTCTKRN